MMTNRFDLLKINFLNCSRKYIEITLENVEVYTGARKDKREKISKKICIFRRHCDHSMVRKKKLF